MKLRKYKNHDFELGGQDSFLDLVSNIVGILIILVMVAGIRAQYSSASIENAPDILAELNEKYRDWQTKAETAALLQNEVEELHIQSAVVVEQILRQTDEYAGLFDLMTSFRADIEIAAEAKSETHKEKIEYQRQLAETNARLEQIEKAKTHLHQTRPQATVLENIPTPLSHRVENKEIHIRLLGGRIAYVPLNELIVQLRGLIGEERHRLFRQKTNLGKVGPIDNFELEFLLTTYDTGGGEAYIGLQYGEAVPAFEPLGLPVRQALDSPQSEFRKKLATFQKEIYTVTVWVYPDSFEEYQALKQFLQSQGYAVAARPMQMGHPIGISPHGTRSATQ